MLEVQVQGHTFHSRESRNVLVKGFKPESFIQPDKPIYIPGQTGLSLNTSARPTALALLVIHLRSLLIQYTSESSHWTPC